MFKTKKLFFTIEIFFIIFLTLSYLEARDIEIKRKQASYKITIQSNKINNLEKKNQELAASIAAQQAKYKEAKRIEIQNKKIITENQKLKAENKILSSYKKLLRKSSRSMEEFGRIRPKKVIAELSMYTSNDAGVGTRTAMGTHVRWGVVAAPSSIPMGTNMLLEGFPDTVFTVEDRGGYIKKIDDIYRIDIYTDSYEKAIKFGRQIRTAYIMNVE